MTQSTLQTISCFSITLFLITGFSSINSITNVGMLNEGNTLFVGGSEDGNYTTIQSAIDAADPGDTVFVYNGVYYENVVVDKTITLDGENRNKTIIDGMNNNIVISIVSDNITVTGFTIKNSGGVKGNAAIYIQSDNTTISKCIIHRSRTGIKINNSYTTEISNCIIHTNGNGLQAEKSSSIIIINSEFCYSGIGINLYKSQDIILENVYAHENGIAILMNESSDIVIIHSASCDNNDNGGGIYFYNSHNITVNNSNAIHSGAGFKIVNSTNIYFDRCNLQYNTHFTFWIENNSYNITINQCNIVNNLRHGIHITDSSCSVINSNLYNNLIDSVFPTNSKVTAENNFWGSKLGPVFTKGFRLADTIGKDFGKIKFFPWKTTEYENIGTDWVVGDTFEKTIIHGYGDSQIDLPGDDTDNDGVPNWWEIEFGYNEMVWNDHGNIDPDGDALTNIEECYAYSWGADPFQKDIFLEIDHTPSNYPDASNVLPQEYIEQMKERFAEHDIVLHVDQGELNGGEEIPYITNFDFSQLVDLYWEYFLHNDVNNPRKNIFHYGIICDQSPGNGFAFIGWAHLNSFCISADVLSENHLFLERGWLITCGSMHETGHTLGLIADDFGGIDNHAAMKPKYPDFWYYRNYKSSMNYGAIYSILDYSDGDNGKVDYDDWAGMEFDFFKNTHFEWPKN
jgi:nitrous oxidase accessory protein NosD